MDLRFHAKEFCDCLDDNFLVQHIITHTKNDKILDLVIMHELDMITDICDLGALAPSDYHALQWRVSAETIKYCTHFCAFFLQIFVLVQLRPIAFSTKFFVLFQRFFHKFFALYILQIHSLGGAIILFTAYSAIGRIYVRFFLQNSA